MFELTGKTALVTGATGGIGGAIARALHAQGAKVAISGTRREVEQLINNAAVRVRTQAETARAQLDRDADVLASTIVERVLGRKAS